MIHARDRSIRGQENRIENLEKAITLKCEQRGIKQGQINLDLVDEERLAKIRAHEDSNPVSNKRAASAMTKGAVPIASPGNSRRVSTASKASSQSDHRMKLPDLASEREDPERERDLTNSAPDGNDAGDAVLPDVLHDPAAEVVVGVQVDEPDPSPEVA
jgi:hypothetical protein